MFIFTQSFFYLLKDLIVFGSYAILYRRIKSEYEADIHELEKTISAHRLKLNEARTKIQEYEDRIANLTVELNKCHVEHKRLQDVYIMLILRYMIVQSLYFIIFADNFKT